MNIKLSEIDDAKTRFFTACSHELRIPVTLITTPVSAITSGKYGETINADSNVLKIIERNCFRLKRLADSLLDFLRFESGAASPVFTDFDLSVWLHSLSGIFSSDAECKNIFFENNFESEFGVRSDPVLLETVVINLLSNAIKHTPQTGKIVLSPVVQNGVRGFSVFNSGSEILSEQIPFLFERFKAASALGGTNYKGFGIGLPLSAEIVKALGGTIKAQNVKDGVLFTVILQNALTEHLEKISESKINNSSAITSSLQNETHNSKSKILIVDDTSDMLDFLCSVLSSEFDVKTAISAEDALKMLSEKFEPELIISDIMMPKINGIEFRRRLVENHLALGTPFLFLSARQDTEMKLAGFENGAVDYILKPFDINILVAKIHSLINLGSQKKIKFEEKILKALQSDDTDSLSEINSSAWKIMAQNQGLSQTDINILERIKQGLSDKEIASELDYSVKTISNRISAMLKKTGAKSRTALATFIFK